MASRVKGLVCLWHHEHGRTYRSHDFSGRGRSRVLVSWRLTRDIGLYIIFFITQIHRVCFVSVNGRASRVKPSKNKFRKEVFKKKTVWTKQQKKFWKIFQKKIFGKKFSQKNLRKKIWKKKFWKKNFEKKCWKKKFEKKCWKKNFGKKFCHKKNVGKKFW